MTTWIQRIGSSPIGIALGLVLFVVSLGILFGNEGRFDRVDLVNMATPLDGQKLDESLDGEFVAATGSLDTSRQLGDEEFLLAGDYLAVKRKVEMYAWRERSGAEELEYVKEWVETPTNTETFSQPDGHKNPEKAVAEKTLVTDVAKVDGYFFEPKKTGGLPEYEVLELTEQSVSLPESEEKKEGLQTKLEGNYLFVGEGEIDEPKVGDLRISYEVVRPGSVVTVFGKLQNNQLIPYLYKDSNSFYVLEQGTLDEVLQGLDQGNQNGLWIFRVLGFLLMWGSLLILMSPLQAILNLVPVLGFVSKNAFSTFTLIIAAVLSVATISFSLIVHNLVLLVAMAALLVAVVIIYFFYKRHVIEKSSQTPVELLQTIDRQGALIRQTEKLDKVKPDGEDVPSADGKPMASKKTTKKVAKPKVSVKTSKSVASKAESKTTKSQGKKTKSGSGKDRKKDKK